MSSRTTSRSPPISNVASPDSTTNTSAYGCRWQAWPTPGCECTRMIENGTSSRAVLTNSWECPPCGSSSRSKSLPRDGSPPFDCDPTDRRPCSRRLRDVSGTPAPALGAGRASRRSRSTVIAVSRSSSHLGPTIHGSCPASSATWKAWCTGMRWRGGVGNRAGCASLETPGWRSSPKAALQEHGRSAAPPRLVQRGADQRRPMPGRRSGSIAHENKHLDQRRPGIHPGPV